MFPNSPLFPDRASEMASQVDHLFFFALAIAVFFSLLIAGLIFFLGVKYHRRSVSEVGQGIGHGRGTTALEITWSVVPLLILVVMFVWGARIFVSMARPPADSTEFYVVGKQWMWKIQHPEGNREINEIHVPLGTPIKLTMTSQDVIHSFFLPAFRVKADVLPGRYTTVWFRANKIGTSYIFCSQYCGAEHSQMIGHVVVMEPHDYQAWLAGVRPGQSPAQTGEELFVAKACSTCHRPDSSARAPILNGLFGREVLLQDGRRITADAAYFRESILNPQAAIVAGYQPIMPTFTGQISEDDLIQLIAYVKSLKAPGAAPDKPSGAPAPAAGQGGAR